MKADLKISFRQLEHTEALDDTIRKKVAKLDKYFKKDFVVNWTSWVEKRDHHSKVHILGEGKEFIADASSDDLYKTFDVAIQKIEKQLSHAH